MLKAGFCIHLTGLKVWAKTYKAATPTFTARMSFRGIRVQKQRAFSACFQQNETTSRRGGENNNGRLISLRNEVKMKMFFSPAQRAGVRKQDKPGAIPSHLHQFAKPNRHPNWNTKPCFAMLADIQTVYKI